VLDSNAALNERW